MPKRPSNFVLASERIYAKLAQFFAPLTTKWQALAAKDRLALKGLGLFFVLVGLFLLLSSSHSLVKEEKMRYETRSGEYFWLRAQAAHIRATPIEKNQTQLYEALTAAGVAPQVDAEGDGWRLSFAHEDGELVAHTIAVLEGQGFVLTELKMNKSAAGQIEVIAQVQ